MSASRDRVFAAGACEIRAVCAFAADKYHKVVIILCLVAHISEFTRLNAFNRCSNKLDAVNILGTAHNIACLEG